MRGAGEMGRQERCEGRLGALIQGCLGLVAGGGGGGDGSKIYQIILSNMCDLVFSLFFNI